MRKSIRQFFATYKARLIWLLAVVALLVIVIGVLSLFNPRDFKTSIYRRAEMPTEFPQVPVPEVRLNPLAVTKYVVFQDSRLPFTFKYPANWFLSVRFSKDRANYSDTILINSLTADFTIQIESKLAPNPDSQVAKDFVQTSSSNPFRIILKDYVVEDFEVLESQNRTLLLSKTGGSQYIYYPETNEVKQRAARFVPGNTYFVYEKRGDKITENLSIVRGDSVQEQANTLIVKYETIANVPVVGWQLYSEVIKQVVLSIEPVQTAPES